MNESDRPSRKLPHFGTRIIHLWPVAPMFVATYIGWSGAAWFFAGAMSVVLFGNMRYQSHEWGGYRFTRER